MTRLTMTRMALGRLRGQKKRYFSLASGIFLAVFFATALVLASASLGKTMQDDYRARMGEQDVALLNIDATEETIRQTGIAQRVGTVEVFGEIAASPEADAARVAFGRYDETAAALAHPACLEGRMPQQAGEIALEASALSRLRLTASVGDAVTLYFYPLMGRNQLASEPIARTFTLTGVLAEKASHLEISRVTFEMHYTRFPAALASEAEEIAPGSLPPGTCCSNSRGRSPKRRWMKPSPGCITCAITRFPWTPICSMRFCPRCSPSAWWRFRCLWPRAWAL